VNELNIRWLLQQREQQALSHYACRSEQSSGRQVQEDPCSVRTAFQHDRDRILHCKSFRRLKHKTQVFLSPEGDHYRTRLTHTLEVSQIARTVARALALNEDLTEAIALGHDLGHTPFGHAGERVLNELTPGGFRHGRQSLRVVDVLEKEGVGLNLTFEVRDGILKHSKGRGPLISADPEVMAVTLEGRIVRLADIVAYVNHDLDDALRAGLLKDHQIPKAISAVLGESHSRRIGTMVKDMIVSSLAADGAAIHLSAPISEAVVALRDWLFDHVYQERTVHDDFEKASHVLRELYVFFAENEQALLAHGGRRLPGDGLLISVVDFIAGMTDRYAMNLYHRLFLPQPWKIF
jgi:dGTPase